MRMQRLNHTRLGRALHHGTYSVTALTSPAAS